MIFLIEHDKRTGQENITTIIDRIEQLQYIYFILSIPIKNIIDKNKPSIHICILLKIKTLTEPIHLYIKYFVIIIISRQFSF